MDCAFCKKEFHLYHHEDPNYFSNNFCSTECEHAWVEEFTSFDEAFEALRVLRLPKNDIHF